MHKLLLFMKRRKGLSFNGFRAYLEIRHVPLWQGHLAGVRRFVRRYPESRRREEDSDFDVLVELWFDDRAALDAVLKMARKDEWPEKLAADQDKLFDRAATRAVVVSEAETAL